MKNDEAILELGNLISDDNADRENEALLHAIETIRYVNEKVKAADDVIRAFKRPHGKWLGWINEIWGGTTIYCSNCKIDALRDKNNHFVKSNFCPNCGADMREEDLSDDGCGGY